jgi:F-type H+-transporting ATPase subunit delta
MAELLTIARPYAEAAFKLAIESKDVGGSLASWSDALGRLATVTSRPEVQRLLGNPQVNTQQLVQLVGDAAGSLDQHQKNFLQVVTQQERLNAMPEVLRHFSDLRNKQEATLEAEVTSAFPMSEAQLADVVSTLKTKYGKQVKTSVKVDNALIGGVSIRVGDEVTDTSIRGKLAQLKASLLA